MKIKTLSKLPLKDQITVFNQAFADYIIEFQYTEERKLHRSQRARADLDLSIGVYDDKKLVAFIFSATGVVDGHKTVYNGGTGVIPAYRGKRLVKKMYEFAFPIWKAQGYTKMCLEVIVNNEFAIKAYESIGLSISHKLISLGGALPSGTLKNGLTLDKKTNPNWSLYAPLQAFEYAWDFCRAGVEAQADFNQTYELRSADNQLLAFAIINGDGQIAQAGIQKPADWLLLMKALSTQFDQLKWINIHEKEKELIGFLQSIGWKVLIEQYEMKGVL